MDNSNLTFPLTFRNLERVKGPTSSLRPVAAAITLWVTTAGVVRVQGNAAVAEEAAVPTEHLSLAMRDLGAALISAPTIDDVGGTAGTTPGESPCARRLSEEDRGERSCDAELHSDMRSCNKALVSLGVSLFVSLLCWLK